MVAGTKFIGYTIKAKIFRIFEVWANLLKNPTQLNQIKFIEFNSDFTNSCRQIRIIDTLTFGQICGWYYWLFFRQGFHRKNIQYF